MGIAATMRLGWKRMPDRVAGYFCDQTSPGVYAAQGVSDCWRRSRGVIEGENSGGVYCFQRAAWFIPKAKLPEQPTPGDLFRLPAPDNQSSPYYGLDGDYIVLPGGVREVGSLGAWELDTAIPFLQDGLTTLASIYRPTMTIGDGGRINRTGQIALYTSVSVRIQQGSTLTAYDVMERLQIPNTATVFLSSAVDVQAHDYLVDNSGDKWSIMAVNKTDMLGVLQSLDCERLL